MRIEYISIKDHTGEEVHRLNCFGEEALFGRDPAKCSVKFSTSAKGVSRVHASLSWTKNGVVFKDDSTYGSSINGKRIVKNSEPVSSNSTLTIGETDFQIELKTREVSPILIEEDEEEVVPLPVTPPVEQIEEPQEESIRVSSKLGLSRRRLQKKRKPDESCTFAEESRPRVKRGPISIEQFMVKTTPFNLDEPSVSSVTVAPSEIMEVDNNPAIDPLFAVPTSEPMKEEIAAPTDRGPSGVNETIVYADLIFNGCFKKPIDNTMMTSNAMNFKRFKPKQFGRTSAASFNITRCANTTSNVSIPLIDSKCFK